MARHSTMRRVRKGKRGGLARGTIVTWHVNSADRSSATRVYHFVFGNEVRSNGKTYRYPGFVEKEGVRYVGQSTLFVRPRLLEEIDGFLTRTGVEHELIPATLG